ncbi:MAG: hypothetical protein AABW63_01795 [Nanoarchaeota archaeon]
MSSIITKAKPNLGTLVQAGDSLVPRPSYAVRDQLARKLDAKVASGFEDVAVYSVFDITHIMHPYMHVVKSVMSDVGKETLNVHDKVSACALGVGEHRANDVKRDIAFTLGDYGIDNKLTKDSDELIKQINFMPVFDSEGLDFYSAYECLAHDLASRISFRKMINENSGNVILFFGAGGPHCQDQVLIQVHPELFGCPSNRGISDLVKMANLSDHTYFIDCHPDGYGLRSLTYAPIKHETPGKSSYFHLRDAEGVLKQTITGIVKKAVSKKAFLDYTGSLPPQISSKVTQLIEYGKG